MFKKNRIKQTKEKCSLFIVNSVYQLFNAINMRMNNIPGGKADIILSDHTPVLRDYISNLEESKLFDNVFYCETLAVNRGFWKLSTIEQNLLIESPTMALGKYNDINSKKYDSLYVANTDVFCKLICYAKAEIDVFLFEDGLSSYTINWHENDLKHDSKIKNFTNIYHKIRSLYVYNPKMLCIKPEYPVLILPAVDKGDSLVVDTYNKIFN